MSILFKEDGHIYESIEDDSINWTSVTSFISMFKPKFKRISKDYPQVSFFMVDGERSPEARKTVQIDNLPYFAVYRGGVFVEGRSLSDEAAFRAFVDGHLAGEAEQ